MPRDDDERDAARDEGKDRRAANRPPTDERGRQRHSCQGAHSGGQHQEPDSGAAGVQQLLPGDQFGEIALLRQVLRRANVTATNPATTLSLPRDAFVSAVRSRVLAG